METCPRISRGRGQRNQQSKKNIYMKRLIWILLLNGAWSVPSQAADVVLRVFHPHEVRNLVETDKEEYPVTYAYTDVLQYNIDHHDEGLSPVVRGSLKTNRITEEWIVKGELETADQQKYDDLVRRIAMGERTGWSWGDLILYREPSFDYYHPKQQLRPGPWNDARILSAEDIRTIRRQLKEAYEAGKLKRDDYKITQLIYAWENIGEAEKEFLLENFDGVYVELNSRDGNWVVEGEPTQVTRENYDLEKAYKIPDFGIPGMQDCADMAKWCMDNDMPFGITMGANLRDLWLKDMFEALMIEMRARGVDPADPRITYVLHHNRKFDDDGMPYFPESEEASMANLAEYLIRNVGQLTTRPSLEPGMMHNESLVFCSDLEPNRARLLFDPAEVISVRRADGSDTFEEGVDYTVAGGGWLELTPDSTIPVLDYYADESDKTMYRAKDTSGRIFYSPGGTRKHKDWDIVVTYTHDKGLQEELFAGAVESKLTSPNEKLEKQQPVTITFLGDSITFGAQASSLGRGAPPFLPSYGELIVEGLREQYDYDAIHYVNKSVGGKNSGWGLEQIHDVIETDPDLVVLAFGMNDVGGMSTETYKQNTEAMIQALRVAKPDVGVILVAEFSPNPDWAGAHYNRRAKNRAALHDLYSQYENIAFVDVGAVSRRIVERKKFMDISGNNINHPNDFLTAVYADLVDSAITDSNYF